MKPTKMSEIVSLKSKGTSLRPVSRELLHELVYDILKNHLMTGQFEPGQKLPLRGLADSLDISLAPVRDAVQRIESMGGFISTTGRTMMVPKLTHQQVIDINRLRIILEGVSAENAARDPSHEDLERLRELCNSIKIAAETYDPDLFLETNHKFHMNIALMSGNEFMLNIMEPLWLRMGPMIRKSITNADLIKTAFKMHIEIYEAIKAKDPIRAKTAIINDIHTSDDLNFV